MANGNRYCVSRTACFAPVLGMMLLLKPLLVIGSEVCEPEWLHDPVGDPGLGWSLNSVDALAVFDDGSGHSLFAGGFFNANIDGESVLNIAKWDGESWSKVGGSANGRIFDLIVHDAGTGPHLYAAGEFTEIGGASISYIARWDGQSWHQLGGGVSGRVEALYSFSLNETSLLIAGGTFTSAGSDLVGRVASWNGTEWGALGYGADERVRAIGAFRHPENQGSHLIIGGHFSNADGNLAAGAAYWSGTEWRPLPTTRNTFDSNAGHQVYVFGSSNPGGVSADNMLFLGGWMTDSSPPPINNVLGLGGTMVDNMGGGTNNTVHALLSTNLFGGSERLYVGGNFSTAGLLTTGPIATWDGTAWNGLGGDLEFHGNFGTVADMAIFDDGSSTGPALFVSGSFNTAAGHTAYGIAKYGCDSTPDGLIFHSRFESQ